MRTGGSDGGPIRAAGGVLVRAFRPGRSKIAIVHRPRYDDWSFPKGKADFLEPDQRTALREVEEETGYTVALDAELPTLRYRDHKDRPKVVRYWLMHPASGEFRAGEEVDELRWVGFAEAEATLSYDHDRRLLEAVRRLLPAGHPAYLIRHAKAGNREAWTEDDALRPLAKAGRRQAEGLVETMRDRTVGRIVSSPYVRCLQTVRPLALSRQVSLEEDDALSEGAPFGGISALLAQVADRPTVVCSHLDVIGRVVEHLEADGLAVEGRRGRKKCSIWTLERDADGEIARMRYEPPAS